MDLHKKPIQLSIVMKCLASRVTAIDIIIAGNILMYEFLKNVNIFI